MLKSLAVNNFTIFAEAKFDFGPGINVIIGANGSGKSHLLKIGYVCEWASNILLVSASFLKSPPKGLAEKLVRVFRPESLGRLVRRGQGRQRAQVTAQLFQSVDSLAFSFAANSKSVVTASSTTSLETFPIFFPTKELLSTYPGFASLYRDYHIEMDETYYDLCLALERPLLRGERYEKARLLLDPLEEILGGTVRNENGRFVLQQASNGKLEMPLVAEGIRKLASVAQLIANGSLTNKSTLYWDEPETNLNPLLMVKLAELLVKLAQQGTQIIIATHSLFLLKEIDLQIKAASLSRNHARFFALAESPSGTQVQAGNSIEEIEPITALDAEIDQAERYEAMVLGQEQAGGTRNA